MRKGRLAALAATMLWCMAAQPLPAAPAAAHGEGMRAASAATATAAAALIDGAMRGQRFVVLGEMHGTAEIPAITGELAARWTGGEHRQPLLLGLEAAGADQARVERYLASPGSAADRAGLLAGAHWTEPMHDGRDSVAMAALIERVRALRAAGADISIAMFDVAGDGERNARMAAALRGAIGAHPDARVLVLTGNVHAMTGTPPQMFNAGKPVKLPTTMARHLADLHPVSIDFAAAQGDFWACQATCGPHTVAPRAGVVEPTLERFDPGESWDWLMRLPRFTASPPAITAVAAPVQPADRARGDGGT